MGDFCETREYAEDGLPQLQMDRVIADRVPLHPETSADGVQAKALDFQSSFFFYLHPRPPLRGIHLRDGAAKLVRSKGPLHVEHLAVGHGADVFRLFPVERQGIRQAHRVFPRTFLFIFLQERPVGFEYHAVGFGQTLRSDMGSRSSPDALDGLRGTRETRPHNGIDLRAVETNREFLHGHDQIDPLGVQVRHRAVNDLLAAFALRFLSGHDAAADAQGLGFLGECLAFGVVGAESHAADRVLLVSFFALAIGFQNFGVLSCQLRVDPFPAENLRFLVLVQVSVYFSLEHRAVALDDAVGDHRAGLDHFTVVHASQAMREELPHLLRGAFRRRRETDLQGLNGLRQAHERLMLRNEHRLLFRGAVFVHELRCIGIFALRGVMPVDGGNTLVRTVAQGLVVDFVANDELAPCLEECGIFIFLAHLRHVACIRRDKVFLSPEILPSRAHHADLILGNAADTHEIRLGLLQQRVQGNQDDGRDIHQGDINRKSARLSRSRRLHFVRP